jgi:glycosyltransferase involved in cell wall biosynthesis
VKICVLVAAFAISGVPLAQVRLARALAAEGHDVDLVIGCVADGDTLPPLGSANPIVLGRTRALRMLWPLRRYLRRSRPDIVFSAEDHLNTVLLAAAILARSRARISGSSRVTPFDTYSGPPFSKPWLLKQAARAVAWRADALTCVSQGMVEQYRQVFPRSRHVCVYNIVDQPEARMRLEDPVDDPWFAGTHRPLIVAAGTLAPWKGFDDLIRAMAIVAIDRPAARLVILGDGPSRRELEKLVSAQGLLDRVRLPGRTDNPLAHFARADLFVLSSRVEGMPNVLVEAMLAGCTPVATACPTGPRELLADGRYGYLVPVGDPTALAAGIARALDRPIPANRLAEAIRPFEQHAVIREHFRLLGLAR